MAAGNMAKISNQRHGNVSVSAIWLSAIENSLEKMK
jgi:hypothetical protein